MHCRPDSRPHSLSPFWVCLSYQEPCFYLTWGSLQIHKLLFPALQICRFPLFFPAFLFSEVTFISLGLFFSDTACSSLLLLLPCFSLLLSWSDFPIFPSAVTISYFLTWRRRSAKHPVWCVSRKWGERWCTAATDWLGLCAQSSTSRVTGWKWAEGGAGCDTSGGGRDANRMSLRQTCEQELSRLVSAPHQINPRPHLTGRSGAAVGASSRDTDPASISWRMGCTGHSEGREYSTGKILNLK